jgi:hypothetical protein
MTIKNLEQKLRELAEEVNQISDASERKRLQKQIDELKKEVQEQRNAEPTYMGKRHDRINEIYQLTDIKTISVESLIKGEYGKYLEAPKHDPSHSPHSCTIRYDIGKGNYCWKDKRFNENMAKLLDKLREKAKQEAKEQKCDAVLIEEDKTEISGCHSAKISVFLGSGSENILYTAKANAEFYRRK